MKYYFAAFCLLLGSLLPIQAQTIRQIEVSFPILKGKMRLQGVVSQVAEAPQQSPILVLERHHELPIVTMLASLKRCLIL